MAVEGVGERLRCQTPSTTSTPPLLQPPLVLFLLQTQSPLTAHAWPLENASSHNRRAPPTPTSTPSPCRPSIQTTLSNREADRKPPVQWQRGRGAWGLVPQCSSKEHPGRRWGEMDNKADVWIATRHEREKSGKKRRKRSKGGGNGREREAGRETEGGQAPISLHSFNLTKQSAYYWQCPYWQLPTVCVCVCMCAWMRVFACMIISTVCPFSALQAHNSNKVGYVSKCDFVYVRETT